MKPLWEGWKPRPLFWVLLAVLLLLYAGLMTFVAFWIPPLHSSRSDQEPMGEAASSAPVPLEPDEGGTSGVEDIAGVLRRLARAQGQEYLKLRKRVLQRPGASAAIEELEDSEGLDWSQRCLLRAVGDHLDHQEGFADMEGRLAWTVASPDPRMAGPVRPRAIPEDLVELYGHDPRLLPEDSYASQLLRDLSGEIGLLAELILAHDEDTYAEVAARVLAEKGPREIESTRGPGRIRITEDEGPPRSAEGWLAKWPEDERKRILADARRVAVRALVFDGEETAVALITKVAKDYEALLPGPGFRVVREAVAALEFIGTDAAIDALRTIDAGLARKALKRLKK